MKYLVPFLSSLLFLGCGGGGGQTDTSSEPEDIRIDLFPTSTPAKASLSNATQLYLTLKYLGSVHPSLLKITSNTPKDTLIVFNNRSTPSPTFTKRTTCKSGGWKEQKIEQIDYDTKSIVASISYHQCHQDSLIDGTKRIEYSLDPQDLLTRYTESYPSDFMIDDVRYIAGSRIEFDHFHYTGSDLDKYTALSTLKVIIDTSSGLYTLGSEDLEVAYTLSGDTMTFEPKHGKFHIKDASKYFTIPRDQDTIPFSIAQNRHLLSGKVIFEDGEQYKITVSSEKEDILSFSMEDGEQTHLSW